MKNLCYKKPSLVFVNSKPFGIACGDGYKVLFPKIARLTGQLISYDEEVSNQIKLANYLLECLKNYGGDNNE